ncbi:MAG: hypothetical protein KKD28_11390 [Chloroflexi bacterium]|nr:hypothetical protein [Chloroflexota bacterium]
MGASSQYTSRKKSHLIWRRMADGGWRVAGGGWRVADGSRWSAVSSRQSGQMF